MAAICNSGRGGRPRIHPVPDDRYRLVHTKRTVIVLYLQDDEVHCRFVDDLEEATFSVGWLVGHADLQYQSKARPSLASVFTPMMTGCAALA